MEHAIRDVGLFSDEAKHYCLGHFSTPQVEKLATATYYISGATGFIGRWLIAAISVLTESQESRTRIVAISRSPKKAVALLGREEFLDIEVINWDELRSRKLASEDELNIFINAATPSGSSVNQPAVAEYSSAFQANLDLINYASKFNQPPVFLHLSSGAVYGDIRYGNAFPERESFGTSKVESEYSKIKRRMEISVNEATNSGIIFGLNPRLFAFAGPILPLDRAFAIGNFLNNARNNQPVQIKGNPRTLRSYLSPIDMSVQVLKCAEMIPEGTIHIGSKNILTIEELAEYISLKFGIGEVNYADISSPLSSYFPENRKTWEKLKIGKELSLKEMLQYWNSWLIATN